MNPDCSLTVVIPTLGGNVLERTIQSVMSGSVVPEKILIVIPEDRVGSVPKLAYKNVEILPTKFRGQVKQRIFGFISSKTELVMQLDDDIELGHDCIEILISKINTNSDEIAAAPALRYKNNNVSIFFKKKIKTLLLVIKRFKRLPSWKYLLIRNS